MDIEAFVEEAESGTKLFDMCKIYNISLGELWELMKVYNVNHAVRLENQKKLGYVKTHTLSKEINIKSNQKMDKKIALEMFYGGFSDEDIGDTFGISPSAVALWRYKNGLLLKDRKMKGEIEKNV